MSFIYEYDTHLFLYVVMNEVNSGQCKYVQHMYMLAGTIYIPVKIDLLIEPGFM